MWKTSSMPSLEPRSASAPMASDDTFVKDDYGDDCSGVSEIHRRAADGATVLRRAGRRSHLAILADADLYPSQPAPRVGSITVRSSREAWRALIRRKGVPRQRDLSRLRMQRAHPSGGPANRAPAARSR